MSNFDFRLQFNLTADSRIGSNSREVLLREEPGGRTLRLVSGQLAAAIKELPRAAIMGGPYDSAENAGEAANAARNALLLWALEQRVGIDLGSGFQRSFVTDAGRALLESQLDKPVRNDRHGIDVYEHQEEIAFVLIEAQGILSKNPNTFVEEFGQFFEASKELTAKQSLAIELYCASFFDTPFRSRFITLVTAIEALLEPAQRSSDAIELVGRLRTMVTESSIDGAVKESMVGSLQWLESESIQQAGGRLAETLLGSREYSGMIASRYFKHCYDLRSQIVHKGRLADGLVNLMDKANNCQAFVGDLLQASVGITA